MCHLVIVNSYIGHSSGDLNKRQVGVLCYKGCTCHCFNHECISFHYSQWLLVFPTNAIDSAKITNRGCLNSRVQIWVIS